MFFNYKTKPSPNDNSLAIIKLDAWDNWCKGREAIPPWAYT